MLKFNKKIKTIEKFVSQINSYNNIYYELYSK